MKIVMKFTNLRITSAYVSILALIEICIIYIYLENRFFIIILINLQKITNYLYASVSYFKLIPYPSIVAVW